MAGKKGYQKKEVRRTEEGFYICDRCGGYFEEHEMTRGRYGIIGICKKCTGEAHKEGAKARTERAANQKRELEELRTDNADLKRQLREAVANALAKATGRELLLELKRRGYEGNFTIVTRKTIDLSKLE